MMYGLIMCRSLTYAQRAARELERAGIAAFVAKVPQNVTDAGCAYCVKVAERRLGDALRVLRQAGHSPERAFLPEAGGNYREVKA